MEIAHITLICMSTIICLLLRSTVIISHVLLRYVYFFYQRPLAKTTLLIRKLSTNYERVVQMILKNSFLIEILKSFRWSFCDKFSNLKLINLLFYRLSLYINVIRYFKLLYSIIQYYAVLYSIIRIIRWYTVLYGNMVLYGITHYYIVL